MRRSALAGAAGRRHYGAKAPITLAPAQPFGIAYDDNTGMSAYNQPGALVVVGRTNYADTPVKAVSAAGGCVLIYLDVVVINNFGTYHSALFDSNAYGSAVPAWPGNIPTNGSGLLADFRVGGILLGKLEAVLEKMVADNPHMGGFFLDDLGSRSFFPDFDWSTFGSTNQSDYRAGAIAVCQVARTVCDRHGLIFVVNGTFQSGTLAAAGGGYPSLTTHGCSLADGGVVEHHDGQISFFGPYGAATGTQWATASTVTLGAPVMLAINSSSSGVTEYAGGGYPYCTIATVYDAVASPWGSFHSTGLPSHTS